MSDTDKRRLIELSIPLDAISAQSAREKSIRHGHISTLHIWWGAPGRRRGGGMRSRYEIGQPFKDKCQPLPVTNRKRGG